MPQNDSSELAKLIIYAAIEKLLTRALYRSMYALCLPLVDFVHPTLSIHSCIGRHLLLNFVLCQSQNSPPLHVP